MHTTGVSVCWRDVLSGSLSLSPASWLQFECCVSAWMSWQLSKHETSEHTLTFWFVLFSLSLCLCSMTSLTHSHMLSLSLSACALCPRSLTHTCSLSACALCPRSLTHTCSLSLCACVSARSCVHWSMYQWMYVCVHVCVCCDHWLKRSSPFQFAVSFLLILTSAASSESSMQILVTRLN